MEMIQMFTKKRNKKGFTLIELIVVIAILGILAAVAIPKFSGTLTSSKLNADKATAKTIVAAVALAQAEGTITVATAGKPTVAELKTGGYLESEPVSQSAGGGFTINYDVVWHVSGITVGSPAVTVYTP